MNLFLARHLVKPAGLSFRWRGTKQRNRNRTCNTICKRVGPLGGLADGHVRPATETQHVFLRGGQGRIDGRSRRKSITKLVAHNFHHRLFSRLPHRACLTQLVFYQAQGLF